MQVDDDAYDYIFYTYGLSLYGNMPLIEALEYKEVKKIEELAIAIDTSESCEGETIRRFLEETFAILRDGESFFRKINVHIIQCDADVQMDKKITSTEELDTLMEEFEVRGSGGTDFRPVFRYVDTLVEQKVFQNLKGLIYFTDGYGIFPRKRPAYDTAFVFYHEDYTDCNVPPWAMKVVLGEEELEEG
jgi:predicted metal-dependent peptidase